MEQRQCLTAEDGHDGDEDNNDSDADHLTSRSQERFTKNRATNLPPSILRCNCSSEIHTALTRMVLLVVMFCGSMGEV
jgi:hypothetical protein